MGAIVLMKRASGVANRTGVPEADTALISGLELSAAGVALLFNDAFTTGVTLGGGATASGAAQTVSIEGGDPVDAATPGGAVSLLGGAGNTSGAGGALILTSGTGGATDASVSGAITITSGSSAAANGDTGNVSLDAGAPTGAGSAGTLSLGGANASAITLGSASITTTIPGNLVIQGTTTSIDNENVQTRDNHIYLNKDYTTASGQTGGLSHNYLPIAANATTSASGGFATTTTVNTAAASGLATGGGAFVQVSNADNPANDGIYQAVSHSGNLLTITSSPTHRFCNTAFTVDTGDTSNAVFTNVNITVIQAKTDGVWESGAADDATALGTALSDLSMGTIGLQDAYDNGATIAGSVALDIDLTAGITIDSTGTIAIGGDADAAALDFGTGAAVKTVTLGSLNTTSSLLLQAGATGVITFDSNGMTTPLPFNGTTSGDNGNKDLQSTFAATTLVGALNELKKSDRVESRWANQTGGLIAVGTTVAIDATGVARIIVGDASDATVPAGAQFLGVTLEVISNFASGQVVNAGSVPATFGAGETTTSGTEVFQSETAGKLTTTAPTGDPGSDIVVESVGFIRNALTYNGTSDFLMEVQLMRGSRIVL